MQYKNEVNTKCDLIGSISIIRSSLFSLSCKYTHKYHISTTMNAKEYKINHYNLKTDH